MGLTRSLSPYNYRRKGQADLRPSFTPCWLVTWANSLTSLSPGTLVVIEKVFPLRESAGASREQNWPRGNDCYLSLYRQTAATSSQYPTLFLFSLLVVL